TITNLNATSDSKTLLATPVEGSASRISNGPRMIGTTLVLMLGPSPCHSTLTDHRYRMHSGSQCGSIAQAVLAIGRRAPPASSMVWRMDGSRVLVARLAATMWVPEGSQSAPNTCMESSRSSV